MMMEPQKNTLSFGEVIVSCGMRFSEAFYRVDGGGGGAPGFFTPVVS
jgi:hypothetical protein